MTMDLLAIALELAAAGLPVFPCARTKMPAIAERNGGRGFRDASCDPASVRRLFSHRNAHLIGMPTGAASGFDALDLDYRHGAREWERANAHRLSETRVHRTPSGGRHLLFHHAPGVRNSASRIAPGIDVRGQGGYIVHPPSTGYSVTCGAAIAHWPDWLLPLALPPPEKPRPRGVPPPRQPVAREKLQPIIDAALCRVRDAADGAKHFTLRNQALLLGGVAKQAGLADCDALRWLLSALPASVHDWRTAETTAAWGLAQGRARPIELHERKAEPRPPDPRRKQTARAAFRLLRMGVGAAELADVLHQQNQRRPDPLTARVIDGTARWAALQFAGPAHAR